MKKSLYFYTASACVLLASGLHLYLSLRSFKLKLGLAEDSALCSINERWNCDAALLSSYGEIFGIPLSLFGLSANLFAAFLLMRFRLNPKAPVYFMGGIALASLVMTAVSLWESLFCPLCYLTYALSYIGLFAVFKAAPPLSGIFSKADRISADNSSVAARESGGAKALLQELLKIPKGRRKAAVLWTAKAGAAVAGLAFLFYIALAGAFNLKDSDDIVKAVLIDYRSEPALSFKAPSPFISPPPPASPSGGFSADLRSRSTPPPEGDLTEGESFMHITEFADFLCPYCKKMHPLMEKFLKNRPGVSFTFYVYPLDSQCNKQVSFSNGGLSCRIAKLSFCLKRLSARRREAAAPSLAVSAAQGFAKPDSAKQADSITGAESAFRRKPLNILKLVFQKQNVFLRSVRSGDGGGDKGRGGPATRPGASGKPVSGAPGAQTSAVKTVSEAESRLIQEAGLSEEETLRCLNDSQTEKALQLQTEEGFQAGLSGVPAFFVNGKRLHVGGGRGLFQSLHALYKELQP